jgi:hypothetical protein
MTPLQERETALAEREIRREQRRSCCSQAVDAHLGCQAGMGCLTGRPSEDEHSSHAQHPDPPGGCVDLAAGCCLLLLLLRRCAAAAERPMAPIPMGRLTLRCGRLGSLFTRLRLLHDASRASRRASRAPMPAARPAEQRATSPRQDGCCAAGMRVQAKQRRALDEADAQRRSSQHRCTFGSGAVLCCRKPACHPPRESSCVTALSTAAPCPGGRTRCPAAGSQVGRKDQPLDADDAVRRSLLPCWEREARESGARTCAAAQRARREGCRRVWGVVRAAAEQDAPEPPAQDGLGRSS